MKGFLLVLMIFGGLAFGSWAGVTYGERAGMLVLYSWYGALLLAFVYANWDSESSYSRMRRRWDDAQHKESNK